MGIGENHGIGRFQYQSERLGNDVGVYSLELQTGDSEMVELETSFWEDMRLPGCEMPECPEIYGEKNCLIESPYHPEVYDCKCEEID